MLLVEPGNKRATHTETLILNEDNVSVVDIKYTLIKNIEIPRLLLIGVLLPKEPVLVTRTSLPSTLYPYKLKNQIFIIAYLEI